MTDTVDNFDYPKPLKTDPDIYTFINVLHSETERLDLDIEHLYDQRFIETASGEELERIGFEVGIKRQDNETDEHLRSRIYATYAAQSSKTTYDDFASNVLNVIGADKESVSISTPPDSGEKNVDVNVSLNAIEESPLTQTEASTLLEQTVSADASVTFVRTGTFGFAGDPDNKGFGTGTWSEGV